MIVKICPHCNIKYKFQREPTRDFLCPTCKKFKVQSTQQITDTKSTQHCHWLKLHNYAPDNASTWDVLTAKKWYAEWFATIPNISCNCREEFRQLEEQNQIDFSTPEKFFESGWYLHNLVNKKLGKHQLRLEDVIASYWPARHKPQKPNLVICVATGPAESSLQITRPSLEAYAQKTNADFLALTNTTEKWWGYEKFRVQQFVPMYQRTLFVDSDLVIKPRCPNLFDIVPPQCIGAHDDCYELDVYEWLYREREEVAQSQGREPHQDHVCLNTGVVVCSRHHEIWKRPEHELPTHIHCAEQFWVEQQMFFQQQPWYRLPTKYNTQWWMHTYNCLKDHADIVHLAMMKDKQDELSKLMNDYFYETNSNTNQP